jgi:hypothetical protein
MMSMSLTTRDVWSGQQLATTQAFVLPIVVSPGGEGGSIFVGHYRCGCESLLLIKTKNLLGCEPKQNTNVLAAIEQFFSCYRAQDQQCFT